MEQIENPFNDSFTIKKCNHPRRIRRAQSFARTRTVEQPCQTLLLFNFPFGPRTKILAEMVGKKATCFLCEIKTQVLDQPRQQAEAHLGTLFDERIQDRNRRRWTFP